MTNLHPLVYIYLGIGFVAMLVYWLVSKMEVVDD